MKLKEQREEFRKLEPTELRARLIETKQELFNLRFLLATNGSTNNAEVRRAKKQLARIHTLLREKELAAAATEG